MYIFIIFNSLFAPHMFENLTCPLGPYDKNMTYTENAPELYENIEVPTTANQDDPYGGENCKCDCHNRSESEDDLNLKNNSEHCVSCGTRVCSFHVILSHTYFLINFLVRYINFFFFFFLKIVP